MVGPQPRSASHVGLSPALGPAAALTAKPPSVQSPFAQCRRYLYWGDVPVPSEDITPPSSLIRTHAPIPFGSPLLQHLPRWRSLCRLLPAPAAIGIFPTLSLRIFPRMPGPLPRRAHRVHIPVSSSMVIGLPQQGCGSASPLLSANTIFHGAYFRGCRHSLMFKPPSLLTSQIVPTPARYRRRAAEAFYDPSRTCFVTSACIGYASRPSTGNWRHGDSHPARFAALSAASPCLRFT